MEGGREGRGRREGERQGREGGARAKLGFPPALFARAPPSLFSRAPPSLAPSLLKLGFPPSLQPSLTASYTF